jgi:hypothetical protein
MTTDEGFDLVVGVAEGRVDLAEAANRLRPHLVARSQGPLVDSDA